MFLLVLCVSRHLLSHRLSMTYAVSIDLQTASWLWHHSDCFLHHYLNSDLFWYLTIIFDLIQISFLYWLTQATSYTCVLLLNQKLCPCYLHVTSSVFHCKKLLSNGVKITNIILDMMKLPCDLICEIPIRKQMTRVEKYIILLSSSACRPKRL